MGHVLGFAAEILIILLMGYVQWQIGRLILNHALRFSPGAARAVRLFLVAAGVFIASGLILSIPKASALPLPWIFAGWNRGAALLWTFSSSCAWVVYRLLLLMRIPARNFSPTRRALLRATGGAAVAAPFGLVGFGALVGRTDFQVWEVDVPVPGLHPDLAGLRLVQLSDIHLSAFLSEKELARVIDASNQLRGHVVVVTGDLISVRGDPLDACLRQLARLRSDSGVLGCLGNHEIYAECEDYTASQGARLGMPFLRRETRRLRFGDAWMNFGGVDYQKFSLKPDYLRGAEHMIAPGALNILLSHNPDVFPVAAQQGWDLTLSGHTHGGQVNVEILHQNLNLARFYTPYVQGFYQTGRSSIYVTRGIGTIGMPARLGAAPEITVLRLKKV